MNIFATHCDPEIAAHTLCDKHIPKMIVETTQLLCTAHRLIDGVQGQGLTLTNRNVKRWTLPDPVLETQLYLASYVNHPCSVWARSTHENYLWLHRHGAAMCREYTRRYGKVHRSEPVISLLRYPPGKIQTGALEAFAVAMPDEYKLAGQVESYRNYYIRAKSRFAYWKDVNTLPQWFWRGCKDLGIAFKNDSPDLDAMMLIDQLAAKSIHVAGRL